MFLGERKFACEQCIRGHRSSRCNHTNRTLYEVRKKGRPQSQCDQCHALRSKRDIHIRCDHQKKPDTDGIFILSRKRSKLMNRQVPVPPADDCGCGCSDQCSCCRRMLRVNNLLNPEPISDVNCCCASTVGGGPVFDLALTPTLSIIQGDEGEEEGFQTELNNLLLPQDSLGFISSSSGQTLGMLTSFVPEYPPMLTTPSSSSSTFATPSSSSTFTTMLHSTLQPAPNASSLKCGIGRGNGKGSCCLSCEVVCTCAAWKRLGYASGCAEGLSCSCSTEVRIGDASMSVGASGITVEPRMMEVQEEEEGCCSIKSACTCANWKSLGMENNCKKGTRCSCSNYK